MEIRTVNDAFSALTEAALSPGAWPEALDQLAGALGGVGGVLIPRDPQKTALGFPTARSVEDAMAAFIKEGWYLHDIRGQRAWPRFATGTPVVVEQELTTPEERRSLAYYQDFFGAFDLPWCCGIGFGVDGQQWCLTLFRSSRLGEFDAALRDEYAALAPSLGRVVSLAAKFRSALDARTLADATTRSEALILIDQSGQVLDASPAVNGHLGAGLVLTGRRLRATNHQADQRLQSAIAKAIVPATGVLDCERLAVAIPRVKGHPLLLEAIPLPGIARDSFTGAVAILTIKDPNATAPVSLSYLQEGFGLTLGEAKLARLLGTGRSLEEACVALDISQSTARSVLKRVFSKMQVTRQAELTALVSAVT